MKITVNRIYKGEYTIGKLYIGNTYFCDTLEDKDRNLVSDMPIEEIKRIKVYGETAIPKGTYRIDLDTVSSKFKDRIWAKYCEGKIPRLRNVKGFEGVLIHVGNSKEDSLGCLLVGYNKIKGRVVDSTKTFESLYAIMKGAHEKQEEIIIEIC